MRNVFLFFTQQRVFYEEQKLRNLGNDSPLFTSMLSIQSYL